MAWRKVGRLVFAVKPLAGTATAWPTLRAKLNRELAMETYDPHKNTSDVRQASPRTMNLRVLVFSLIGIVVLFGIVYAIYTGTQPNPN